MVSAARNHSEPVTKSAKCSERGAGAGWIADGYGEDNVGFSSCYAVV
jgi:hypothetical protein